MFTSNAKPNQFDAKDAFIAQLASAGSCSETTQLLSTGKQLTSVLPLITKRSFGWGRRFQTTWTSSLFSLSMMIVSPCLVIFFWITLEWFDGSLLNTALSFLSHGKFDFVVLYAPRLRLPVLAAYMTWVLLQAGLYYFLPGPVGMGQLTPAGHQLEYTTNGFSAWLITHALFLVLCISGVIDLAIIAKNWPSLLLSANILGLLLSLFAYLKAHLFPTHTSDLKFSGSRFYDLYMGIEFNPRLSSTFDLKLFTNGRPGIVAWTLIDLSFIAWQYQIHGYISNSIVIATTLHTLYVVDFFWNEDWYLRTIDIAHDHFGFYLAWGSLVWLPSMYTLQTQYLARYPVDLEWGWAVAILGTGVAGYGIFRSVNWQKDIVRKTGGECVIWGKKAEVMVCTFVTKDGGKHESLLLCSGWWGLSRHANYLGDLILSYSMCATCGVKHLLPWFYAVFMTILLLHRCHRDEKRCAAKYGDRWEQYVARVPWKLIPGVY